jgi:hypothetical protein
VTFQVPRWGLAAALGHVTGRSGLALLRRLRPTRRRSADDAPACVEVAQATSTTAVVAGPTERAHRSGPIQVHPAVKPALRSSSWWGCPP